jgi:addiction module HigA family antidote
MIPKNRKPTTPGEILKEEFLKPLGLTQKQLAQHISCDIKVINRIVNDRTSVVAEMAIKLGAALNTSPEFWLNAQQAVNLYRAMNHVRRLPVTLISAAKKHRQALAS